MNNKADLYKGTRMYHPNAMTSHNSTYKYINTFSPLRWQVKPWSDTSNVILLSGSRGGGKLLDVNTPIPTPDGFKNMGDIELGDTVFDEMGRPTRVVAVSGVEYPRKSYLITFDDGSTVVAGSDHMWLSHTYGARVSARNAKKRLEKKGGKYYLKNKGVDQRHKMNLPRVITTEEMLSTLMVNSGHPGVLAKNHAIKTALPLELPEADLPIPPYCFGMWLGDGNSDGGGFTTHIDDVFMLEEWSKAGYQVSIKPEGNRCACYIYDLAPALRELGVLDNKRIPTIYLRASVHQRIELLQGLIDTDGHINDRKQAEIDMARPELMKDIKELVNSLGIKSTIRHGKTTCQTGTFDRYRMKFTTNLPVARLPRKLDKLDLERKLRPTQWFRYVVSIDEVENRPMKCIQVENESHLYLCTENFIPTHNSRLCGERLHAFCLKYPNAVCQVMRKTKSSLKKSVIHNLTRKVIGDDPRVIHHESDGMFMYDNGSVLYYDGMTDPSARERLKSREPDMVWLEEAKDFDEEDFNEIRALVRGTAAPWRQIMLSTNPDGPLHWINRRLILGREARVYYSGARDNPHLPPEYLENLESLTGVQYQRDVLGLWVAGTGQIFDTWVDDPLGESTNVTELAEIIPHGGDILWFVDDGYSGTLDPSSGLYTANSHPRAMLLVQRRRDGILAVADESYAIEVLASNHIAEMLTKWPRPSMVVRDRAAASFDGACRENGIRNIVYNTMNVDESIKEMRTWLAADSNGVRRVIVHPRCKMLCYEMAQYSTDNSGLVIKQHDNGVDALRYGIWNEAYGRGRKVDVVSWSHMERAYA